MRVLGPLEVRAVGGLRPIGGRRAQRVLGALVARSASFSSLEVLIDDVWGTSLPKTARNSLQTYISRLRTVVEPLEIRREGGAYRLVVGPGELDALEFEELCRLARGAVARRRWPEALEGYERALGLWRGAAFADLRDVTSVAGWATRLDEERLRAREGSIRAQSELGGAAEVVGELEDLAVLHPWREPLWALWATVLYRQGRQVDALGVLRGLRRRLADELGLQPGPEVEELEGAILRHDPALALRAEAAPTSGARVEPDLPADLVALRARRMIGRDDVLVRAEECWGRVRSGRCTSLFVAGEAGIGKSRLAAELAQRVVADGGLVLYGRATERIDLAYQPFAHALRGVAARHLEALGDRATDLAPLLRDLPARTGRADRADRPESDGVAGPGDDPGLIGPDDRRFRLLEAVGQLLSEVADPGGLLVVLDDLHCASGATLGLLEHLLTVSRPDRVMVLGTIRDTDVVEGGDVDRFLADIPLRALGPVPVVRLEGLDAPAVAGVLHDHGRDAAPREVDRVRDLTAGNPLLITELLHTAGGKAFVELDGTAGTDDSGVPASVTRLILARVRRLGDAGEVLAWAALIGTDFEFDVLRLVMDVPDVLERLEEASHAGLVRELGAGCWQFRHALTADALRRRTGATRLAARHEAIADALEVALPADVALGRIAHHRCAAARPGRVRPAVDASLRAARLRLAQLAPAEALLHVGEGSAALGNGSVSMAPGEVAAAEAELQLAAAEAHQQLFAEQDRIEAADAALAAARRAGSSELVGRAAVMRAAFWTQGRLDAVAVAALEEALAALDRPDAPGGTADLRSQLLSNLAGSLAVSGSTPPPSGSRPSRSPEALVALAEEAVRLAQRGGNAVTRLLADSGLAVTLYGGPWAARQLEVADRMAHRGGDLDAVYGARWSAAARLALGDRPGFERDTDVLCREGARHGLRALQAYGLQCAALLALLDARFDDAEAAATQAVTVGRAHENFTRVHLAQQFWIAAERGRLAAIEPVARAVAADAGLPIFAAMLGLVLCSTGATAEAARLLDGLAADGFRDVPRDILWLPTVAACAEIAAATGRAAHAPTLGPLLAPYTGQLVVVAGSAFVYGAVDRFRAMLAALQADAETAVRGFDAAIGLERRIGAGPLEVRSRWWRLRLLGDAAGDDRTELADLAGRLDLGWLADTPPAH